MSTPQISTASLLWSPLRDSLGMLWDTITRILTTRITLGEQSISLVGIAGFTIAVIAILFVANQLKRILRETILAKLGMNEGNREVFSAISKYVFIGVATLILLQESGLDLSSLAIVAGGLGLGIGLGLQNITLDIVSGITILAEGNIKAGHYVEFDDLSGYIRDVSLRSTIIRNFDGGDVILPNSSLIENRVLNWSYDTTQGRLKIPIGVAYGTDPIWVTELLLESAYREPEVLYDPPPKVLFSGFGESSLNFILLAWIGDIEQGLFVQSSLNHQIEYTLRQNHIELPFPQQDIWLRNPELWVSLSNRDHSDIKIDHQRKPADQPERKSSLRYQLSQIPCFNFCNSLDLLKLIELGRRQRVPAGEILLRQGQIMRDFYIILTGCLEGILGQEDQEDRVFGAGDYFGEIQVMLGMPSPLTLRAQEDSTLFVINRTGFCQLLKLKPEFGKQVAQAIAQEHNFLRQEQRQLKQLGVWVEEEEKVDLAHWVQRRLIKILGRSEDP